jgi:protein-S-isoprenylcysteine O-methyltransferase Ste14
MYDRRQRRVALLYGILCHASFALGVAAMGVGLYLGLTPGRGPFHGAAALCADALLAALFVTVHSFLLTERGGRVLERLAPLGLGRDLASTTFAWIASLQLLMTFALWSPIGPVWWEPHGAARAALTAAYAASWALLLKAMSDAGLAVQTGALGWRAVAAGRRPSFGCFPTEGCFRFVRQPVYLAFALTLWTGAVWTPDHLFLALAWTAYCALGPRLKERRYLRRHGEAFARWREGVPYWLPRLPRA